MNAALILAALAAFDFGRPTGLGSAVGAQAALATAGAALDANPAMLGKIDGDYVAAGMTWPFGMSMIHYNVVDAASRRLAGGARLTLLGTAGYAEMSGSVAKALGLVSGLDLGGAVTFYCLNVRGEKPELAAGLSAGAAYQKGTVKIGMAAQNVNRPALTSGDLLPMRAVVGAALQPVRNLSIAGDLEYSDGLRMRLGGVFEVTGGLTLAAGFGTDPLHCSAGIRAKFRGLFICYCLSMQSRLGDSHMLSLGFGS